MNGREKHCSAYVKYIFNYIGPFNNLFRFWKLCLFAHNFFNIFNFFLILTYLKMILKTRCKTKKYIVEILFTSLIFKNGKRKRKTKLL